MNGQIVTALAPRATSNQRAGHRYRILPVTSGIALLILWQLVSLRDSSGLVPTPFGILNSLPTVLTSAAFWSATVDTAFAVIEGLVIACVIGTVLGLVIGRVRWIRALTAPYVSGLYAMPLLALVPLVTIWLGYSPTARLALIIFAALLPCIASTADGARRIPTEWRDAAFVLRVPRHRLFIDLYMPGALPSVMSGVSVAIGRAVVAAVAVEFLASVQGLGNFILVNARSFHHNNAFVGVIVLVVLGLLIQAGVQALRRRWAPWNLSQGE